MSRVKEMCYRRGNRVFELVFLEGFCGRKRGINFGLLVLIWF